MAEIFKEAQAFNNNPDRWNHDLSHKVYGSYKAGRIYPVFTHLMEPTDSIELDSAALLQFMPTPTPLQSNARVIFHVHFQRMKNIWKDWPNFIEMLEDHEAPYILPSVKDLYPGSLHDYLDVPIVHVVDGVTPLVNRYRLAPNPTPLIIITRTGNYSLNADLDRSFTSIVSNGAGVMLRSPASKVPPAEDPSSPWGTGNGRIELPRLPFNSEPDGYQPKVPKLRVSLSMSPLTFGEGWQTDSFVLITPGSFSSSDAEPFYIDFSISDVLAALDTLGYDGSQYIHIDPCFFWENQTAPSGGVSLVLNDGWYDFIDNREGYKCLNGKSEYYVYGSYTYSQFPEQCPFATKEFPDRPIKLRAYRHRVYESIYNAFYRNIHGNQPFVIDGVTKYNQYNTTTDSGVDNTDYHFFNRNWELDPYTSALATPQQGEQPLVGISATGRLTIQSDDGTVSSAQLVDLDRGQQGLAITQINAANDEHRSIMMNLASSGISINDLRETNALQKFLETNIRKGFRYIDFILGHFGKAPKHAEMDMPEFIGGYSVKLDVGKVTNTAMPADPTSQNVLGQFAGTAQAFGGSNHKINYYADDYGYLQVEMMIVPDAAYSQILPKDYIYSDPLDFPFPEFSQLTYQPITYETFCPGECYKDMQSDPNKRLTDVFGYQRPQYERVWLPDRLHGQFLTSMNNYCVNRVFEHRPELGDDFFQIKPEDMQRVFSVYKGDYDIAFGQIAFHITYKQPVPRTVIPSLGR